jgi:hypothetical protein
MSWVRFVIWYAVLIEFSFCGSPQTLDSSNAWPAAVETICDEERHAVAKQPMCRAVIVSNGKERPKGVETLFLHRNAECVKRRGSIAQNYLQLVEKAVVGRKCWAALMKDEAQSSPETTAGELDEKSQ